MSRINITVALTAHSETVVAGPTMKGAEAAIRLAEIDGLRVERLIGFDTPTDDCRDFFSQPAFSDWKTIEFRFRDQGQTRNALAEIATGRWIAFLDADDMYSENWLVASARLLAEAEQIGERVIAHPELNYVFDGGTFVFTKPAQDDPLFTPYYFFVTNYYDALCMAPRETFMETPYAVREISGGFAYEDWQWNIETMAAGWRHVIARDTIIFKRRRDASQTHESRGGGALIRCVAPMAINKVMALGHAHQEGCPDHSSMRGVGDKKRV